jgi:hypothetical protein
MELQQQQCPTLLPTILTVLCPAPLSPFGALPLPRSRAGPLQPCCSMGTHSNGDAMHGHGQGNPHCFPNILSVLGFRGKFGQSSNPTSSYAKLSCLSVSSAGWLCVCLLRGWVE